MFKKSDEALHKGLMKILDEGTFQLKAREVPAFAQIYAWARDLPKTMRAPEVEPKVSEEPIKKARKSKKES